MKKLIELLNEHEKTKDPSVQMEWREPHLLSKYNQYYIFSKDEWFIKWLVENDKIRNIWWFEWKPKNYLWDYTENKAKEYTLLMLLAISDNPIEFLINTLK